MPGSNVSLSIPNYTEAKKNLTGNFEMTLSAKFYEATPDFPAPILPSQVLVLPNGPSQQIQIPKVIICSQKIYHTFQWAHLLIS